MSIVRQQIVDAIDARMKQIAPGHVFTLPSGPYTCGTQLANAPDGGPGVYQWRKVPYSKNQVPALEFRDTDAPTKPGPSTQHEHELQVGLVVFFAGGTADESGRIALADIVAAIGSDPKWGGLARWTDIDETNVDMDQAGDVIGGVQVNCTVTYRTPLFRL